MENYIKHTRKVEKKIFTKPLLIYKITNDDALIYCLRIIQYFLELESTEKIYVEDKNLINECFYTDREEFKFLSEMKKVKLNNIFQFDLEENEADLSIVIGGDGTILWANHIFKDETRPPFLAFNLGTLGYMATYCSKCYKSILDDVLNPKTPIYYEKRTFLKGKFMLKNPKRESLLTKSNLNQELRRSSTLSMQKNFISNPSIPFESFSKLNVSEAGDSKEFKKSEKNENVKFFKNSIEHTELQIEYNDKCEDRIIYALNDITIERKDFTHMINTEIYYNDEPLTIIKSNGIIISSPTGSTAYSLSAGGTIMHYGLDCFILNSICPFSLSFRPIAFPRGDKLKIILTEDSKDAVIINDGINKYNLSHHQGIEVEISDKYVDFILIDEFYQNKSMMWKQKIIDQLGWNNSFKNVGYSGLDEKI